MIQKVERFKENLLKSKGLHLPADLHELFDPRHGLRFGIGKGMVDNHVIVDRFGNPLPGRGGSGKIFIYPAESSTLDGVSRPIQLTEKRFTHTLETPIHLHIKLPKH